MVIINTLLPIILNSYTIISTMHEKVSEIIFLEASATAVTLLWMLSERWNFFNEMFSFRNMYRSHEVQSAEYSGCSNNAKCLLWKIYLQWKLCGMVYYNDVKFTSPTKVIERVTVNIPKSEDRMLDWLFILQQEICNW